MTRKLFFGGLALLALSAPAAQVRLYFISPATGTNDTNSFIVTPVGSNVLSSGGVIARGVAYKLTPSADGFITNYLSVGHYSITNRLLGSGVVIRAPLDTGPTIYDITNLLVSGYNTFVTVTYGTNPPPTLNEITNALGLMPIDFTTSSNTSLALAALATNGLTSLARTEASAVMSTNLLPGLTNAFLTGAITNGLATTNAVTAATNGLWSSVAAAITGMATTNYVRTSTNGLASTNFAQSLTNGYVRGDVTNALASTNYVWTRGFLTGSATNVLATTNYVHAQAFVTSSITNGLVNTNQLVTTSNALAALAVAIGVDTNYVTTNIANASAALTNQIYFGTNHVATNATAQITAATNGIGPLITAGTNWVQTNLVAEMNAGSNVLRALTLAATNTAVITNDARPLRFTSPANIFWGAISNGVNLGNAFSSPGTELYSEQFGSFAVATAVNATALAWGATASGEGSTAIGQSAVASGTNSISIGSSSGASATDSSAFGESAYASGFQSVALGRNSAASGRYAAAIGADSSATATNSMAIGRNGSATHTNSMAVGVGAATTSPNQIIFGTANEYALFPGNATITGTLTNGSINTTNFTVTANAFLTTTTNVLALFASENRSNDVTYIWNATAGCYTNEPSRIVVKNIAGVWYVITPDGQLQYSSALLVTNTWWPVVGAEPPPASSFGFDFNANGPRFVGAITSTNLDARLTATTNSLGTAARVSVWAFQPPSLTLSNLSATGAQTNSLLGGSGITLTTNAGKITITASSIPTNVITALNGAGTNTYLSNATVVASSMAGTFQGQITNASDMFGTNGLSITTSDETAILLHSGLGIMTIASDDLRIIGTNGVTITGAIAGNGAGLTNVAAASVAGTLTNPIVSPSITGNALVVSNTIYATNDPAITFPVNELANVKSFQTPKICVNPYGAVGAGTTEAQYVGLLDVIITNHYQDRAFLLITSGWNDTNNLAADSTLMWNTNRFPNGPTNLLSYAHSNNVEVQIFVEVYSSTSWTNPTDTRPSISLNVEGNISNIIAWGFDMIRADPPNASAWGLPFEFQRIVSVCQKASPKHIPLWVSGVGDYPLLNGILGYADVVFFCKSGGDAVTTNDWNNWIYNLLLAEQRYDRRGSRFAHLYTPLNGGPVFWRVTSFLGAIGEVYWIYPPEGTYGLWFTNQVYMDLQFDPLVAPIQVIYTNTCGLVAYRDLSDGRKAVLLWNKTSAAVGDAATTNMEFSVAQLGYLPGTELHAYSDVTNCVISNGYTNSAMAPWTAELFVVEEKTKYLANIGRMSTLAVTNATVTNVFAGAISQTNKGVVNVLAGATFLGTTNTGLPSLYGGGVGFQNPVAGQTLIGFNSHYDGAWKYLSNGIAARALLYSGALTVTVWPSGTAGAALPGSGAGVTFRVDTNGTVAMGGLSVGLAPDNFTAVPLVVSTTQITNTVPLNQTRHVMTRTNAESLWPTAPSQGGAFATVNSNGTPYLLLSGVATTNWTTTNCLVGMTTNINVLLEDSTTNQLQFTGGILTGVVPLP